MVFVMDKDKPDADAKIAVKQSLRFSRAIILLNVTAYCCV
jgi:hypothetical protein